MASSVVQSSKMKRMQSKKSHSWWWDSHISPKNSKWLAENLDVMDQSVKRMLKLIEEDADSFAKKAEMYYQKRPELIALVEEFYRMYRSLAERYDHVTGELRKNIPSDLQSQGSGISDIGSEPPSTWPSPVPEQRAASRRKSGPRAAGFDFFLGPGANGSDIYQKEGDESSTLTSSTLTSSTLTDSDSESDDSSVNYSVQPGNGGDQGFNRKVIELEIELRELKEKLRMQQDEDGDGSIRGERNENQEDLLAKIAGFHQKLMAANDKTRLLEEEVTRLNLELQKYKSSEFTNKAHVQKPFSSDRNAGTREAEMGFEINQDLQQSIGEPERENLESSSKVQELSEELRIAQERLQSSEKELLSLKNQLDRDGDSEKINSLQDQLALANKEIDTWKTKVNAEKRGVSKLQERIARLKTSLSDRDHEIRELKVAVADAEQKIFPEKAQIKAEICSLLEEQAHLEEQLKEWESRGRSFEDEIRKFQAEKLETEERLNHELEQLKSEITARDGRIENLERCLVVLRSERDELNLKILTVKEDVVSRDDRIVQMDEHLQELHMQHVELISHAEEAHKLMNDLRLKTKELEEEVEKQRVMIVEGAEEKREAIRQLCLSIEHYRNGYHNLLQAFVGNKRVPVLAA